MALNSFRKVAEIGRPIEVRAAVSRNTRANIRASYSWAVVLCAASEAAKQLQL